jgi:hypothetical protein
MIFLFPGLPVHFPILAFWRILRMADACTQKKKKDSEPYAAATASAAAGGKGAHFFLYQRAIYTSCIWMTTPPLFSIIYNVPPLFVIFRFTCTHSLCIRGAHHCSVEGARKVSISPLYVYIYALRLRRARDGSLLTNNNWDFVASSLLQSARHAPSRQRE